MDESKAMLDRCESLGLDPERIPKHVAIIMDGNGRWAKQKLMPRSYGHLKGLDSVQRIIQYSIKYKIQVITLYAFSTENSKRPKKEIDDLTHLFNKSISDQGSNLIKNNITLKVLGDITFFPEELQKKIAKKLGYRLVDHKLELYGSKIKK